MGLDLTLCPCRFSRKGKLSDWMLAHTRLDLDRNYDIFGQIDSRGRGDGPVVCNAEPLLSNVRFEWYGDEGLKQTFHTFALALRKHDIALEGSAPGMASISASIEFFPRTVNKRINEAAKAAGLVLTN